MNILFALFFLITAVIFLSGGLSLLYYPLAIIAELRSRQPSIFKGRTPLVSIIVPAYNEEKVIGNCIESILRSKYRRFEVILVDDGSKDGTLAVMQRYHHPPRVQVLAKPNGGKASALNAGYHLSKGEVLFFVDADGLFTRTTIDEMLRNFYSPKIGAICGSDLPVNLDRLLPQLMNIQTHVGTGFVRRALAELNCLPIVSGNIGAFLMEALVKAALVGDTPVRLDQVKGRESQPGPFREGFIGEDLELTWRIHRAGYQVKFAPRAIVRAEVPSTVKGLWKQRVRWARGLLQTIRLHGDMFFNLKYGPIGLYLPINFINMVVIPVLQLLVALMVIGFVIAGYSPIDLNLLNILLWFGLGGAILTALFAIALDRAWNALRYFYVLPLWIPYSLMMDAVMVWAIIQELWGVEAKWNKVDRTGVVTKQT